MTRNVCLNNILVGGDVSDSHNFPHFPVSRNSFEHETTQIKQKEQLFPLCVYAEPAARLMKWLLILRPCKDLAPPHKPGGDRACGGASRLGWLWNHEPGNVVTALQRQSKRVQTTAEQREAGAGERKQVSSAGGIWIHWEKMWSPLRISSCRGSAGMRKISWNASWTAACSCDQHLRQERNWNHIANNNPHQTHCNSSFHS